MLEPGAATVASSGAAPSESAEDADVRRTLRYDGAATTAATSSPERRMAMAIPLGDDWMQTLDRATGRPYYCNTRTREVSWDPPASVAPATPLEISLLFDDPPMSTPETEPPPRAASRREPPPPPASAMRPTKTGQPPRLPPDVPPHYAYPYPQPSPVSARVPPSAADPPSRSFRAPLPSATKPWLAFANGARGGSTPGETRDVRDDEFGRGRRGPGEPVPDLDGIRDARSYSSRVLSPARGRDASARAYDAYDANAHNSNASYPTAIPRAAAPTSPSRGTRGWIKVHNAPLGLEYYHHVETGESSWTLPASDYDYDRFRSGRISSPGGGYPRGSGSGSGSVPPPPPARARRRSTSSSRETGAGAGAGDFPDVARPQWRKPNDDDERWAAARRRGEAYREAREWAAEAASPRRLAKPNRRASLGGSTAATAAAAAAASEPSARERALSYGERVREREATKRAAALKKAKAASPPVAASPVASPRAFSSSSPRSSPRLARSASDALPRRTVASAAAAAASAKSRRSSTSARRISSPSRATLSPSSTLRSESKTNAAQNAAAIAIQRRFRGRLARKKFAAALTTRRREAADATAREHAATAARALASASASASSSKDSSRRASLFSGEGGDVAATIFIQRRFRGHLARKKFAALRRWSLVQSVARLSRSDDAGARLRRDASDAAETLAGGRPEPSDSNANANATVTEPETLVPFEEFISKRYAGVKGARRSVFAGCCGAAKLESASHLARYSAAPIRDALTVAARAAGKSADAVRMFRAIRAYMGDAGASSRSEKDDAVLQDAVWLATSDAAATRDEFYCQLCKQTTRHPNAKHELKGWRLMYLVAVAFTPGPELAPYVLSHCRRAGAFTVDDARLSYAQRRRQTGAEREKNHVRLEIAAVANLAATRLAAALAQGSRGTPPGEMDAHAAENAARRRSGAPRGEPGDPPVFGAAVEEIALLEELRRRFDARRKAASNRANETRALLGTDLGDERGLVEEKDVSAPMTMTTLMMTTPPPDSPLPRPFAALVARLERADARETRGLFRATPPGADPMSAIPPEIARRFASPKRDAVGHYAAVASLCDPWTAAELLKAWLRALALPLIPASMYRGCLESEATGAGMSQALAPLPQMHRRMLTATLRAAGTAARAEGERAQDAASEIAAALSHVVMRPPAAYDGGGADEVRQHMFVERMIRMMMTLHAE